jgi:hypothetical protein
MQKKMEGKRPRGRPSQRWKDAILKLFQEFGITNVREKTRDRAA